MTLYGIEYFVSHKQNIKGSNLYNITKLDVYIISEIK